MTGYSGLSLNSNFGRRSFARSWRRLSARVRQAWRRDMARGTPRQHKRRRNSNQAQENNPLRCVSRQQRAESGKMNARVCKAANVVSNLCALFSQHVRASVVFEGEGQQLGSILGFLSVGKRRVISTISRRISRGERETGVKKKEGWILQRRSRRRLTSWSRGSTPATCPNSKPQLKHTSEAGTRAASFQPLKSYS